MIRIITDDGKTVLCEGDNENITKYKDGVGTLEIKGTSVFKGYLNREDTTKESFTTDGWFKTGIFLYFFVLKGELRRIDSFFHQESISAIKNLLKLVAHEKINVF